MPVVGRILVRFARWCDKRALPWREEIAIVEEHPSLMVGFALSTAALVATPVLNLLFRPIVLIGASHVLGRLEPTRGAAGRAAAAVGAAADSADSADSAQVTPGA